MNDKKMSEKTLFEDDLLDDPIETFERGNFVFEGEEKEAAERKINALLDRLASPAPTSTEDSRVSAVSARSVRRDRRSSWSPLMGMRVAGLLVLGLGIGCGAYELHSHGLQLADLTKAVQALEAKAELRPIRTPYKHWRQEIGDAIFAVPEEATAQTTALAAQYWSEVSYDEFVFLRNGRDEAWSNMAKLQANSVLKYPLLRGAFLEFIAGPYCHLEHGPEYSRLMIDEIERDSGERLEARPCSR